MALPGFKTRLEWFLNLAQNWQAWFRAGRSRAWASAAYWRWCAATA